MAIGRGPWVGRIGRTGAIVVYDPSLQLSAHTRIYVFSVGRGMIRQFEPSELRAIVETAHGHEQEIALAAYKAWKIQHGEEFLRNEPLRLNEERRRLAAAEERTREAHRQRLAQLGVDPSNVKARPVAARAHRVTHCYACKRSLDNRTFVECLACNWIICTCGACGCGIAAL